MTTSTPSPTRTRAKTTYPIPSTDLTLHLTLGLDLPLPIASIRSCLDGAVALARSSHSSRSLLTTATGFRFQQPEREKDKDAQFGIVGDPVFETNELSWGDVVGVLRGLAEWIEQREGRGDWGVELWFRVVEGGEQGRGQVGDGYLTRRRRGVEKDYYNIRDENENRLNESSTLQIL